MVQNQRLPNMEAYMYIDRVLLKREAKIAIAGSKFKILLVAMVYLALMLALNIFVQNLSGYAEVFLTYAEKLKTGEMITDITQVAWPEVNLLAWIIVLSVLIMRMIVHAGYINYILLSVRGTAAGVKNLLDGFYFPVKVVVMETVKYLIVAAGFVCFVIPGIVLSYMFRLNIYVMFDNQERSAFWCLKESARLMRGRKMELFTLDLSFFGWYFFSYICTLVSIPIIDIWVSPYTELTYAGYYNRLIGWQKQDTEQENFEIEGNGE